MSAAVTRVVRTLVGAGALLASLVAAATPAAAHNVGGGAVPAPPWLLSYVGLFLVAGTAVALRASAAAAPRPHAARAAPELRPHAGHALGAAVLALVVVAAVTGPASGAANVAPVAVFVLWLALPIACAAAGDLWRHVNPFVALAALVPRRDPAASAAPPWTAAAFLAVFVWFFEAYHRPGSPRAVAVLLIAYTAAAVAGAVRWGGSWLARGEAMGAVSAAVARLRSRDRDADAPTGLAPLAVVWLGSTGFDALTSTPFWVDVTGTSTGWARTGFNTIGLAWVTAIVAGAYLGALRLAERRTAGDPAGGSLAVPLGAALVPLAAGWFVAHDLPLLLFEGQNLLILLSDPVGRGWNLFGTAHRLLDYGIVTAGWVGWAQVLVLAAGHVAAVAVAHAVARRHRSARQAMEVTWWFAGAVAASIVAGALLVLG